ncbi:MAG: hypothetical protein V3V15_03435 [Sphingorhabdus sp.]
MIKKFKFAAAAAVLALAVPVISYAQDEASDDTAISLSEDQKLFEMLTKAFDNTNATPIDPERLALAQKISAKLTPDGGYANSMANMFDEIIRPMSEAFLGMKTDAMSALTGIDKKEIGKLSEEKQKAIAAILDPIGKDRAKLAFDHMTPFISEAMAAMEPAIREGTARAYARKFSTRQLTELGRFFETSTGGFFAAESYALQADPEIRRATSQAMPLMFEKAMGSASSMLEKLATLPEIRSLTDLNDGEIAKLAELLGVSVETLEENRKALAVAEETGEEPWYDDSNWSKAERKQETKLSNKTDALSDKNDAAYEQYSQAYDAWKEVHDTTVATSRAKYKAQGWTPETAADDNASSDAE